MQIAATRQKVVGVSTPIALTRPVSPTICNCQLTYLERQPINYHEAAKQQRAYEQALREMGLLVVSLPPEPDLPDAVFVEDNAVVLDELAILGATSVRSRIPELLSVRDFLQHHRNVHTLGTDLMFEGGDILRRRRQLYVGQSSRTCRRAIARLKEILGPYSYEIIPVAVSGCLHLSTGASYLGRDTILANPDWVDQKAFRDCEIIAVTKDEPWAANTLAFNEMILMAAGFPRTRALLEYHGFDVRVVDISEFMKAEAGVTCLANIFEINEDMSRPDICQRPWLGEYPSRG